MKSPTPNRRHFLRAASIVTAGATLPVSVKASNTSGLNVVKNIDLGVKPVLHSNGAVTITTAIATYATFDAQQNDGTFGTAIVKLTGCMAHRSANESRDLVSGQIDTESLAPCETFEVENSTWAENVPEVKHFIFTFLGADSLLSGGVSLRVFS